MHELSQDHCHCCGASRFEALFDFGAVPVSGRFRADQTERMPSALLGFELCAVCGLVRQLAGGVPRDYSGIERPTAMQFPAYGDDLITKLKSLGVGSDELVLDIGSNEGSFLQAIHDAGFRRLAGVEPSRELAERARARGFAVENDYFGPAAVPRFVAAHGTARAIVCRHTLEHVPDPLAFVQALRDCLDPQRGVALLEVPDGSAIPELLNVYEFWDEHLYCFCAENVVRLIERAGMHPFEVSVQPHLETRNLLVWCSVGNGEQPTSGQGGDRDCVALWRRLPAEWTRFRDRLAAAVREALRPLYLIGGSHSQYNFANYAGVGMLVDHFIDDDPAKVGRYPPVAGGSPSIISTAQFEASARAGTVLKTGFGYANWTARICDHAARHGMRVLDPKDFIERRD